MSRYIGWSPWRVKTGLPETSMAMPPSARSVPATGARVTSGLPVADADAASATSCGSLKRAVPRVTIVVESVFFSTRAVIADGVGSRAEAAASPGDWTRLPANHPPAAAATTPPRPRASSRFRRSTLLSARALDSAGVVLDERVLVLLARLLLDGDDALLGAVEGCKGGLALIVLKRVQGRDVVGGGRGRDGG